VLGVVQERSFSRIPKRLPYQFSAFVLSFEDRRRRIVSLRNSGAVFVICFHFLDDLVYYPVAAQTRIVTWHGIGAR
jgi:hypothetical protein